MSSTGSLFSQTLQDITNTKLDELTKKRDSFETRRGCVVAAAEDGNDAVRMLSILSTGVRDLFSVPTMNGHVVRGSTNNPSLEIDLKNLDRFLGQARYDPSVSPKILGQWQESLIRHLDVQSLKYSYASLYGQLTTEWLSLKQASSQISGEDHEMDGFPKVSSAKKMEARLKWERSVFEPAAVDVESVTNLLRGLFEATPNDSKRLPHALKRLREKVSAFERELALPGNFSVQSLSWTMKGLMNSDLLTDEKRTVLKDFLGNNVILSEIADVLNMRIATLQNWSWGNEVQLEQRRQLNGTFKIYMHEDLLQAIFLQYIGVKWSVFWKETFSSFRRHRGVWKLPQASIPSLDKKRRDYYLGPNDLRESVDIKKQSTYRNSYFLSQLLNYESQEVATEEGEEEADFELSDHMPAQTKRSRTLQTAHKSTSGQQALMAYGQQAGAGRGHEGRGGGSMRHRKVMPDRDEEEMSDEDEIDDCAKPLNPMDAKQNMLHLLSTDISIKCRLHGEITCFRTQIDNLYPSLPHATIESVLQYFGVSPKWLQFFLRFLRAPLRFMDDKVSEPRTRKRGTPGSHVISEVFGEVVLFCLDFAINQDTGGQLLWRLNDDIWFWSSSNSTCVKAWSGVMNFTKTIGLSLNEARSGGVRLLKDAKESEKLISADIGDDLPSGQIRWGMLYLNPNSGRFEIDQAMVDKHIEELSLQLRTKQRSLFAWIQTWNAYAAKFFTTNFGKPVNSFGRRHVDNMLSTHERIQRQIFSSSTSLEIPVTDSDSGSVVEFLKMTIDRRFGIKNIPDGYFFFPTELGGLNVQNPFIALLQIRDSIIDDPHELLDAFEEAEREAYKAAKLKFDSGKKHDRNFEKDDPKFKPAHPSEFFSFEEYTRYREELNYGYDDELSDIYSKLLATPREEDIDFDDNGNVKPALNSLSLAHGHKLRGILNNWDTMEPYWKWVAQLYGPEMIDRFGGFSIVEPGLLPMGMVSMFRSGRVKWQE